MSFSKEQLDRYLDASTLSPAAKQYVIEASMGPSRNVGEGGYKCVPGEFQSRKMGHSISTESRSGETSYAVVLEYDEDVLAFYDQPPMVDCSRTDKNGRVSLRAYRPDLLVLRWSGVEVIQVKSAGMIQSLLNSEPLNWQLIEGMPVDLAANATFLTIGLPHRVISTDELPRLRIANLLLLLKVRDDNPQRSTRLETSILSATSRSAITTISSLAKEIGVEDLSLIYWLIDQNVLFSDLDNSLLSSPETCLISRCSSVLAEYIESQKTGDILFADAESTSISLAEVPPLRQAKKALKILKELERGGTSRSCRRWRSLIAKGIENGETAFQAVIPKTYNSGNRSHKRPLQVLAFAEDVIRTSWATPRQPSMQTTYATYLLLASEWHPACEPVTPPTFSKITQEIRLTCAMGRGGRRAANAVAAPSNVSHRIIRPQRPFELASCDHCLLKLFAVVFRTEKWVYVQRPWLTALIDCATSKSIATWLSFRRPSRVACAMVLRRCLQRHGRLPEGIIRDRGSEFKSVFFSSLLAHCGIHSFKRPTSDSRYGSECERYFGQFKTFWLDGRPGNITHYKNARAVSGSHAPSAFAQIELPQLIEELDHFDHWLDGRISVADLVSANERMAMGLRQFPFSGRKLAFNESFIIASAVDERKFALDPARGIKVGERWFWGPALNGERVRRKDVEVRLEPEDHSRIYVRTNNVWSVCQTSRAPTVEYEGHFARLAESLVIDGAARARTKMNNDSKIELARLLRHADDSINLHSLPSESQVDDDSGVDAFPFDELIDVKLEVLARSKWSAP